MKQKPDNRLPIIIDTREQLPFFVSPHWDEKITKTVKGLTSGDYSLIGFENVVAIERKSLADLYSSLTNDRKRFEREFQRLALSHFAPRRVRPLLEVKGVAGIGVAIDCFVVNSLPHQVVSHLWKAIRRGGLL